MSLPDDIKSAVLNSLKPSELICFGRISKDAYYFMLKCSQWETFAINLYLDNKDEILDMVKKNTNIFYSLSNLFFKEQDDSWYRTYLILCDIKRCKKINKNNQIACSKYDLISTEKVLNDLSKLVRVPFYAVHLPSLCFSSSAICCGWINLINPIVFLNPILLSLDIGMLCSGYGLMGVTFVSLALFEGSFDVLDKKMVAFDQARLLRAITAKNPRWLKKIEQCLGTHN